MKIIGSRADAIRRERDLYLKEYEEYQEKLDREYEEYRQAENMIFEPIRAYLVDGLRRFSMLNTDVTVRTSFGSVIEVRVACNDNFASRTDNDALSWNFNVHLDKDGSVIKETGSWSGLRATTPAQIQSLSESVDAIKWLNSVDWVEVLNKQLPRWEDYAKTPRMVDRTSEFKNRLQVAEMEDLIGTNTLIQIQNFESSGYRGRIVWVRLLRETPSQYEVNVLPTVLIDDWLAIDDVDKQPRKRVKKSNLIPVIRDGEIVTKEVTKVR